MNGVHRYEDVRLLLFDPSFRFRIWGFDLGTWHFRFRIWDLRFRISKFRIWDLGLGWPFLKANFFVTLGFARFFSQIHAPMYVCCPPPSPFVCREGFPEATTRRWGDVGLHLLAASWPLSTPSTASLQHKLFKGRPWIFGMNMKFLHSTGLLSGNLVLFWICLYCI